MTATSEPGGDPTERDPVRGDEPTPHHRTLTQCSAAVTYGSIPGGSGSNNSRKRTRRGSRVGHPTERVFSEAHADLGVNFSARTARREVAAPRRAPARSGDDPADSAAQPRPAPARVVTERRTVGVCAVGTPHGPVDTPVGRAHSHQSSQVNSLEQGLDPPVGKHRYRSMDQFLPTLPATFDALADGFPPTPHRSLRRADGGTPGTSRTLNRGTHEAVD